jgi:nitrogen fixation protein NifU and related proteins
MSTEQPYDAIIMDHIRNARNYRVPENATGRANGLNPMCGDDLTVYVRIEQGVLRDVAFQCSCCGVSMASASIMTAMTTGLRTSEAAALLERWVAAIHAGGAPAGADPGQLAIVDTVRQHPARLRCAILPWRTLAGALENGPHTVISR